MNMPSLTWTTRQSCETIGDKMKALLASMARLQIQAVPTETTIIFSRARCSSSLSFKLSGVDIQPADLYHSFGLNNLEAANISRRKKLARQ